MYLLCTVCLNCSMLDWLPRPGTEPQPLHWERAALASGLPGKSWMLVSQLLWFPPLPHAQPCPCSDVPLPYQPAGLQVGDGALFPNPPAPPRHTVFFQTRRCLLFLSPLPLPVAQLVPHSRLRRVARLWPARPAAVSAPLCPPCFTSAALAAAATPAAPLSLTLPVSRGSSFRMQIQVPAGSSVFLLRIQCSFCRWRYRWLPGLFHCPVKMKKKSAYFK